MAESTLLRYTKSRVLVTALSDFLMTMAWTEVVTDESTPSKVPREEVWMWSAEMPQKKPRQTTKVAQRTALDDFCDNRT